VTRLECAEIMAYMGASLGKDPPAEQVAVYFDLLQDLPAPVLRQAARRAVAESRYPVIPPVGTLRDLSREGLDGPRLPAVQAWEMVDRAIRRFDYNRESEALASLPPLVARTAQAMGWYSLCFPGKQSIARAQFIAAYESIAQNQEKFSALPADLRETLKLDGVGHPGEFDDNARNLKNEAIAQAFKKIPRSLPAR